MATITSEDVLTPVPQVIAHEITRPRQTKRWVDWVTTTDHKKIGVLYLYTSLLFFLFGGLEAVLIRAQLARPNMTLVGAETYNHWGIIVCFPGGLPYKGAELPSRSRVCMGGRRAVGQ